MKLHANHRTCPSTRRLICRRVLEESWTLAAAAEAAGCSERTASKWLKRYRGGDRELHDRSSRPLRSPNRLAPERVRAIEALTGLRMTAAEIAEILQLPLSTVSSGSSGSGSASARGSSRRSHPTVTSAATRASSCTSTSRSSVDLARGAGHRVTGSRISQRRTRREGRCAGRGLGVRPRDGRRPLAPGLRRSARGPDRQLRRRLPAPRRCLVCRARCSVKAVMSDNGSCYVAHAYAEQLRKLGLRHLRIRPRRPRTNGKVCVSRSWCRPVGRRGCPLPSV